jgi:hypothetical protein
MINEECEALWEEEKAAADLKKKTLYTEFCFQEEELERYQKNLKFIIPKIFF